MGYIAVGRYFVKSGWTRERRWSVYDWSRKLDKGAPWNSWGVQGINPSRIITDAISLVEELAADFSVGKCPVAKSLLSKSDLVIAQFYAALEESPKKPIKSTLRTFMYDPFGKFVYEASVDDMFSESEIRLEQVLNSRRIVKNANK